MISLPSFPYLWVQIHFPTTKYQCKPSPGGKNEHRSLCPFSPSYNPPVIFIGPICGCCSLATASPPLSIHSFSPPSLSPCPTLLHTPQLSPHINYSVPYLTCTQPIISLLPVCLQSVLLVSLYRTFCWLGVLKITAYIYLCFIYFNCIYSDKCIPLQIQAISVLSFLCRSWGV